MPRQSGRENIYGWPLVLSPEHRDTPTAIGHLETMLRKLRIGTCSGYAGLKIAGG